MFSTNHIIWLCICTVLCGVGLYCLNRFRPDLRRVLMWACAGSVLSELIKTFSAMEMVPSSTGNKLYLYLEMQHLPFHLCSLQILLIFYVCFAKDSPLRTVILGFMYPACSIGALCALLMPSITTSGTAPAEFLFVYPVAYQYFLFHAMLILVGLYIPMSRQVALQPRHYWTSLAVVGILGFASLYLNSMFAEPTYKNGKLVSVDYTANFFFTYRTPVGVKLTEMWHWYLYIGIIVVAAFLSVFLLYIPVFRQAKKGERI